MKFKKLKQLICAGILSSTILLSGTTEAGIVADGFPLTCYVDHHVNTFDGINGRQVGYIDANVDWIKVYEFRDGWVRASYNGLRSGYTRWFRVEEICADPNYSNRPAKVQGNQNVFTTRNSNTKMGSVSNNEDVIVLAESNGRVQIRYRLDNGSGYKMGWIPSSAVSYINENTTAKVGNGDVNGDNIVDIIDFNILLDIYLNGGKTYNVNGDLNGDGKISSTDIIIFRSALTGKSDFPKLGQINPDSNISLNVPLIKQTDYPNDMIGSKSIKAIGCTVTSLTMIYNYHNHANMTPPQMVEKLRPFSNNDIVWDNVKSRLGYTTDLVTNRPSLNNEWMSKIYRQLKNGKPVMIGAYNYHWVVVTGYTGNSTTNFKASDFKINDPSNPFTNLQQFINKYNGGIRGIVY